jgi:hypothetical protein
MSVDLARECDRLLESRLTQRLKRRSKAVPVSREGFESDAFEGICRNSFFPSAGLWPALTEEGEAECSRAGNLIGQ